MTATVTTGQSTALTAADVLSDPDIKIAPSLNQTGPRAARTRKCGYEAQKLLFPLRVAFSQRYGKSLNARTIPLNMAISTQGNQIFLKLLRLYVS
jgi:hypothetical protein